MQPFIEAEDEKHMCKNILKYSKPIVHFELRGPTDQFSQLQMLSVVSFEAIVQFCRVAQDSVVMYKCANIS